MLGFPARLAVLAAIGVFVGNASAAAQQAAPAAPPAKPPAPAAAAPAAAAPAPTAAPAPAAPAASEQPREPSAAEREAKSLFLLGSQAYSEARYDGALAHFQDAYKLSGRPALQYNIGLTLANLRRDQEALDAFEKYLADVPDAENRGVVEARIAILRKSLEEKKQRETVVAPTPAETARASESAAAPTDYSEGPVDEGGGGITSKWWFWAGIGGAVAAGVVVGILVASGGDQTLEGPLLVDDMTRVREL